MQRESAEALALDALAWLAADAELFPVFLGATGADLDSLKRRAADPVFLAAVLDFLTMDDAWVLAFSTATGYAPTDPMQARSALPGGDLPHWT